MLLRLLRKINKNKWMFLCLLIGVTLAIIMITSIPIYTRGTLQNTLQSDMEKFKKENSAFPGSFSIVSKAPSLNAGTRILYFDKFKSKSEDLDKKINVPILSKKLIYSSTGLDLSEDEKRYASSEKYKLETVKDLEKHITITSGRLYSNTLSSDGIYEVIVSDNTFHSLDMVLDKVYYLYIADKEDTLKVKVVGTYKPSNENDNFWIEGNWLTDEKRFLMSYKVYTTSFMQNKNISATTAEVDYALDYKKFSIVNYKPLLDTVNSYVGSWSDDMNISLSAPFSTMLNSYSEKENSVQTMLWVLEAPVFIILILYVSMVAKLIVEDEKNEISVLQSRGVSRWKIVLSYFLESIIASIIAMAVGPPLGMGLCKFLGVTSGFLNFNNRQPIFVSLTLNDYKYSLVGIGVFIVTMMVPVFFACSTNIIMHRNERTLRNKKAIWQKYYLDILLFAMSLYGLKNYDFRQKLISISQTNASNIPVDPSIYLLTTLFILSVGLLFLRVYPLIIRVIFKIGKKLWPPSIYASLVNVGRNDGKNQFIMIFIILTIAIGIFNIKCARTLNSSIENKTRYLAGADVVMKGHWNDIKKDDTNSNQNVTFFQEPPYSKYSNLAGAKETTKVFRVKNAKFKFNSDDEHSGIYLMGIITNEFGKTAWFDPSLMKNHWYEYLNLIAKNPNAVLVSNNFANDYKIKPGDRINVSWTVAGKTPDESIAVNGPIDFVVYGIVDYWPTYNPNSPDTKDMIVANLQYLQAKLPIDKYEVWIKKDSGNSTSLLYKDIKKKNLNLDSFSDVDKTITDNLYSIGAQNINGVFNLCFIAIIIVTALAFLIYWTLSIKSRVLQFGILRSMGMALKKIINMLFCEQILISVVSMLMGALIGNITCKIFLPILNIVTNTSDQVLPIKIISFQQDIIYFSVFLAIIFIIVLSILGIYVSKIKMDQAIKLGED